MKTTIIQNDPHGVRRASRSSASGRGRSNLAASVGRLERKPLEDRRVRLARVRRRRPSFLGMQLGTTQIIDQNDANVGESRKADRIIDDAGFTVDEKGESTRS